MGGGGRPGGLPLRAWPAPYAGVLPAGPARQVGGHTHPELSDFCRVGLYEMVSHCNLGLRFSDH